MRGSARAAEFVVSFWAHRPANLPPLGPRITDRREARFGVLSVQSRWSIDRWQTAAAPERNAPSDLRSPPAVPTASPRCRHGGGQRSRRAARARDRQPRSDVARGLLADPCAWARPVRAPLGLFGWPQSCRSPLGGPGSASAGRPRGGGWRLRHSLRWLGPGDIDSVARAHRDCGVVETKTRTYEERHLDRVRAQAAWLVRRRRRWCRNGTLAVLCLVRTPGVQRVDRDVLVVVDQSPTMRRSVGRE